jgi:hypothetical protein
LQISGFPQILPPASAVEILRRKVATFRRKIDVFGVVVNCAGQNKNPLG